MKTFREWLVGGGGFEDGEDGIRACTMSAEHAIELVGLYQAHVVEETPIVWEYQNGYADGYADAAEGY